MGTRIDMAEAVDQKLRLMALAMLLLAIRSASEACMMLVSEELAFYLDVLQIGLMVSAIGLMLHLAYWKLIKVPKHLRRLFSDPDGYIVEVLRKSCLTSWLSTLVYISFVGPVISKIWVEFPVKFFTESALFVMLGAFSLKFLSMYRGGNDPEDILDQAP